MIVAIQADDYTARGREPLSDSSSTRWKTHLHAAGIQVKDINIRDHDIFDHLSGCEGLMWRWAHFEGMGRIARRVLRIAEQDLGLTVYPSQKTCWHYDDKIAQAMLFQAHRIPAPPSWIAWTLEDANRLAEKLHSLDEFPVVLKLASGAGSTNVTLVEDAEQLMRWAEEFFWSWRCELARRPCQWPRLIRGANAVIRRTVGWQLQRPLKMGREPQAGYLFCQKFLPNNDFDTRITVVGNRAFAFRRHNRPADFRASGSGAIDYDPAKIDERFVRLAFRCAMTLGMDSCAIDGLYDQSEPCVSEVSYTFVTQPVKDCPGQWILHDDSAHGAVTWQDGSIWPEEAQAAEFIRRLRTRARNQDWG